VTLTFLGFFFTDPLQYGNTVLAFVQYISQFAWVSLVVLPPILLSVRAWNALIKITFLVAVLAWPVTLITIRVLLLVETGDAYLSYLMSYPIFIFTDILVPLIYVFIWVQRGKIRSRSRTRAAERSQPKQAYEVSV
jgi:hypothetical protein